MLKAGLKFYFKDYFVYFSYYLNEIIGSVIFPIVINGFFLISIVNSNTSTIYSKSNLFFYVIVSNATYVITNLDITGNISKDVKTFRLGRKLLYPIGYLQLTLFEAFVKVLIRIFTIYFPILVFTELFFDFELLTQNIFQYLFSLVTACTISVLISLLIGFMSFFLTEVWGINSIKNFIFYVLSGSLFPFDLLKKGLQNLVFFTPCPYVSYFPTKLLVDPNFTYDTQHYVISILWVIVLMFICKVLWKVGLEKYESCGV